MRSLPWLVLASALGLASIASVPFSGAAAGVFFGLFALAATFAYLGLEDEMAVQQQIATSIADLCPDEVRPLGFRLRARFGDRWFTFGWDERHHRVFQVG